MWNFQLIHENPQYNTAASPSHQEACKAYYPHPYQGRQIENHSHRKLTKMITFITALHNLMKLRAILCRATQDGRVMVESFDKTWSSGEGNGKLLQHSCLENPMNSIEKAKRYNTER